MQDIFLFFKEIPPDKLRDVGPSLAKVLCFREQITDQKKPLYVEFDSLNVFEKKITDTLHQIGWETANSGQGADISGLGDPDAADIAKPVAPPDGPDEYLLSELHRMFLKDIADRRGGGGTVTKADVARLRLISTLLIRAGNDVAYVGVHDANQLFQCRGDLELSAAEHRMLFSVGLKHMKHENVPFWHWTGGKAKTAELLIQNNLLSLDEAVSAAALKIAEIFGYEIDDLTPPKVRQSHIRFWYSREQSAEVIGAANRYLSKCAKEEDVPVLEEIRETKLGRQAATLDCIIAGIKFRHSLTGGFQELISLNPEELTREFRETLRGKYVGLSPDVLERLAKLKAESIRLESLRELMRQDALTRELAEELSGDNSIEVRLEAIKALSDLATPISESSARAALVVPDYPLRTFFSLWSTRNNVSRFEEYRRHLLRKLTLTQLKEIDQAASPSEAAALFTACRRFPRSMAKVLRNLLRDGFSSRFDTQLGRIEADTPSEKEMLIKRASEQKERICLEQTREALNILVGQMNRRDLALVRNVIDRWDMEASDEIFYYLARFGGWEDVERILNFGDRSEGSLTLLGMHRNEHNKSIGRALNKVGRDRLTDLLNRVQSPEIQVAVLATCPEKSFAELDNRKLLELMNAKDAKTRTITALLCLKYLPKLRIVKLLGEYMGNEEYRFYNVRYWLDLGVTMPRTYARKLVQDKLSGM